MSALCKRLAGRDPDDADLFAEDLRAAADTAQEKPLGWTQYRQSSTGDAGAGPRDSGREFVLLPSGIRS